MLKKIAFSLLIAGAGFFSVLAFTGCDVREWLENPPTLLDNATDQDLMDELFDRGLDRVFGD